MRKINEENERIKRRHLQWLKEANRKDQASVDKTASAILRFEASTNYKSFKLFSIEQAIRFKRSLETEKNRKTNKPLSKATIDGILRSVKNFVHWLAGQSGYKSRISYSDAEYFNNSAKDARVAHAQRDAPYPTMEQAKHAFLEMPNGSDIERRNRAVFAFLMLTGARIAAIASLRLKHIDLVDGSVYQDGRDVRTKNSKSFTTWFLPVDQIYWSAFENWVNYLRDEKYFGHQDALFPKPKMGLSNHGGFSVVDLHREPYKNSTALRMVIKQAYIKAGMPAFAPHSFRKTLVRFGAGICKTPEQFKALSLNIGHDDVATTMNAYYPITREQQAELIRGMR